MKNTKSFLIRSYIVLLVFALAIDIRVVLLFTLFLGTFFCLIFYQDFLRFLWRKKFF